MGGDLYVEVGEDGIPIRWSNTPDEDLHLLQGGDGEPNGVYWDGAAWQDLPARPGFASAFDPVAGTWADARTADDFRRAVNAERDRRVMGPFDFGGHPYDFDPVSKQRISGAASLAGFAVAQRAQPGDLRWHGGTSDFEWITADNTLVTMDAQTTFAFGQAAANRETEIVFAAKALKEMDPIPADYTDDGYWP